MSEALTISPCLWADGCLQNVDYGCTVLLVVPQTKTSLRTPGLPPRSASPPPPTPSETIDIEMAIAENADSEPTTSSADAAAQQPIQAIKLLYCQSPSHTPPLLRNKDTHPSLQLTEHDEELDEKLHGGVENALESMSVEEVEKKKKKAETEALKKEAQEEPKASRMKKSKTNKVTVKTVERTQRKRITTIHGLDLFGIDLKKLAKLFASKFAIGSSVNKNNQVKLLLTAWTKRLLC
ncbi:hypothetical protein PTTG_03972 [Puccinia triticina 1-1 BBBD Race 1]|uniref:Translation machinery-associated protein 22 n=1 Tax=Puccinia triticina (isolate 1-1 / race 1 (BBBD)) TaxID=630390 RepID=A0A0C4ET43_PUCT1|nr:hypothetical protein PTTG_03972 [Puccinia triticina 1-1 BBBD Race 1]